LIGPIRTGLRKIDVHRQQAAELPGRDDRLDRTDRGEEAVVLADGDGEVARGGQIDERLRFWHRRRERLLHQDVLPGVQRLGDDRRVAGQVGRHQHGFGVGRSDRLRQGAEAVVLGGEPAGDDLVQRGRGHVDVADCLDLGYRRHHLRGPAVAEATDPHLHDPNRHRRPSRATETAQITSGTCAGIRTNVPAT